MSKIVRYSYGMKNYVTNEEYNKMTAEQNKAHADQQGIEASIDRCAVIESATSREDFFAIRAEKQGIERNFFNKTGDILNDAKNSLFKAIICEAFIEALPIDSYYVQEKMDTFTAVMCDYIDDNGGYTMLEAAVKLHPETIVLRRMKESCDSIALEASKRIFRETKDTPELADTDLFQLNADEKETFDVKKSELSVTTISKAIRDKVVAVVGNERDRQEKEQQLKADLAEATETGSVIESVQLVGDSSVKSSTLYDSLFFSNYKTALESLNVTRENYIGDDDDDISPDHVLLSTDDLMTPLASDIDLDLIMCESILQYTVLETMHTLCLKEFSRSDIEKMSQKLMN